MATKIWVNMDSGNGLVADGAKPLPVPILTSLKVFCSIYMRAIPQEVLMNFI